MNTVAEQPAAYEELHAAHQAHVVRLCRLLLADRHEAEDVAQEVFLKMFRQYEAQDGTQSMAWRPWLTRVTVNACRDRRRSGWWRWWRGTSEEAQEGEYPSPDWTPEQTLLNRETQTRIWQAFRDLSVRQQEVFVCRHLEGWSTAEIAGALGMTPGSVKRHLFRAVQHLRHALGGQG